MSRVLRFSAPADLPPEAAGDRSAWLREVFRRRLDRRRRPLREGDTRTLSGAYDWPSCGGGVLERE